MILGWAPGGEPLRHLRRRPPTEAWTLQLPRDDLPPGEWFTIKAIVRDLVLHERDWTADLLAGYVWQPLVPWER